MRTLTLSILLLAASAPAAADQEPRWHLVSDGDLFTVFSVTGDPDYSLHTGLRPPGAPEWLLGIGFFGGRYPGFYQAILDVANGTDHEDWDVTVDGILLRGLYFLDARRRHFFVGAHVGVLRWENRKETSLDRFNQAVLWPAVGYRWFPGDGIVFLSFWTGVGILSPSFGGEERGPERYEELRVLPFAAAHLGVEI